MTVPWMLACLILQNTWVVDDTPGPGVDFPDLPPAVAAAADGDILLVQPGLYSPFTLSGKGLRIRGSGSANTVVTVFSPNTATTISSLPSTSLAYVDRLRFQGIANCLAPSLLVQGASTRVVLSDVTVVGSQSGTALRVDSASVGATRCSLNGGNGAPRFVGATPGGAALHALNGALVHVSGSSLQGGNGGGNCFAGSGGWGNSGAWIQGGSQVWIADSTVLGGWGGCCTSAAFNPCGAGGTGILVDASILRVSGDGSTLVQGGAGGLWLGLPPLSPPGYGIFTVGASTVTVHSVTVLGGCTTIVPCTPGPATSGTGITLNDPPLPVMDVTGDLTLSGTATVSFTNAPAGEPFLLAAAGAPAFQTAGSLFLGEILVDPGGWFPLASGVLSAAGDFSMTIPLAGLAPAFVHFPVYLQGIALDPGGAFWRVSNSTVATVRP